MLQNFSEVGPEFVLPNLCAYMFELALDADFGCEVVDPQDIGVWGECVPARTGVCVGGGGGGGGACMRQIDVYTIFNLAMKQLMACNSPLQHALCTC